MTSWRELIASLDSTARFLEPATKQRIRDAEARLGLSIPAELKSFMMETDGADNRHSHLMWSLERIIAVREEQASDDR
jgi:cell wall assembly regulator SMI1